MTDELVLVAIQARISIDCFQRPEAFTEFIDELGERAGTASASAAHRLFVFPEGIGFFTPLAHTSASARRRNKVADALGLAAATRPWSLIAGAFRAGTIAPRAALMHAVLPAADALMRGVFARLARRHRATVVAGSHLVARSGGRITNTSYTFDPSGRLIAITDKNNLVPTLEDSSPGGLGLSRGDPSRHPITRTPWGALATLICYDGFSEPHTRDERFVVMAPRVDAAGADVIANPAANPWPWRGDWYFAELGEQILRCDQWRQEGLPQTLAGLKKARYGVTAHLCGSVMDQTFEGRSEILERGANGVRVLASAETHDQPEIVVSRVPAPAANLSDSGPVG